MPCALCLLDRRAEVCFLHGADTPTCPHPTPNEPKEHTFSLPKINNLFLYHPRAVTAITCVPGYNSVSDKGGSHVDFTTGTCVLFITNATEQHC